MIFDFVDGGASDEVTMRGSMARGMSKYLSKSSSHWEVDRFINIVRDALVWSVT